MQHSMNYIKQNRNRLNHIIKNCKKTQNPSISLKKNAIDESWDDRNEKNSIDEPTKLASSLLKTSRVHLSDFEKRHKKMDSYEQNGDFKMRDQMLGIELEKIRIVKKEHERFRKIATTVSTQLREDSMEQNPCNQTISAHLTPRSPKKKPEKNYLPHIQQAYQQTFSPKNASLSQYSLAVRQLQCSVHKRQFQQRCKKYNKENIMKEYESKKNFKEKKLEEYRLSILKKISCENVKRYLFSKMQKKERIMEAERQQLALFRSYIERA